MAVNIYPSLGDSTGGFSRLTLAKWYENAGPFSTSDSSIYTPSPTKRLVILGIRISQMCFGSADGIRGVIIMRGPSFNGSNIIAHNIDARSNFIQTFTNGLGLGAGEGICIHYAANAGQNSNFSVTVWGYEE